MESIELSNKHLSLLMDVEKIKNTIVENVKTISEAERNLKSLDKDLSVLSIRLVAQSEAEPFIKGLEGVNLPLAFNSSSAYLDAVREYIKSLNFGTDVLELDSIIRSAELAYEQIECELDAYVRKQEDILEDIEIEEFDEDDNGN